MKRRSKWDSQWDLMALNENLNSSSPTCRNTVYFLNGRISCFLKIHCVWWDGDAASRDSKHAWHILIEGPVRSNTVASRAINTSRGPHAFRIPHIRKLFLFERRRVGHEYTNWMKHDSILSDDCLSARSYARGSRYEWHNRRYIWGNISEVFISALFFFFPPQIVDLWFYQKLRKEDIPPVNFLLKWTFGW